MCNLSSFKNRIRFSGEPRDSRFIRARSLLGSLCLSACFFAGVSAFASPEIVSWNKLPDTPSFEVGIRVSGDPEEHIDIIRKEGIRAGRSEWRLHAEGIRPQGTNILSVILPWNPGTDSSTSPPCFYSAGRSDIDEDLNGISDFRQKFLDLYDLPVTSRAPWALAGINPLTVVYSQTNNVMDFGAAGDGMRDDTESIRDAIDALSGAGVVFLPAGTYKITGPLFLDSDMILRGAGSDRTRLIFSGNSVGYRAIGIVKWHSAQVHAFRPLTETLGPGDTVVRLASTAGFSTGDVVELESDNKSEWNLTDSWQQSVAGQIGRIQAIDSIHNTLLLDRPLRVELPVQRNARIRKLVMVENVGIENLYLERETTESGYTIEMKYAVNCWVKGVESAFTYKGHVNMETCFQISIRESYFYEAHAFGGGGQGYGVSCSRHTSDCLIEDNVFNHLRHSMSVGSGANGNVFGYNFSINRAIDPVYGTPQADISVHGNYVFMNLFEGNVVEDADVPDWYHPAGPRNTLFRNRILNNGRAIDVASDNQNIIANDLPNGYIEEEAELIGTVRHANRERGSVDWASGSSRNLPASFYRAIKPVFFAEGGAELEWPAIGPDCAESNLTPSEKRYMSGQPMKIN